VCATARHSFVRTSRGADRRPLTALPVYYAVFDGDVAFRTDPGTKLGAAVLGTKVVFEIDDEVEGWSVFVSGHCREVRDAADRERALAQLDDRWPTGEREHVVRITPSRSPAGASPDEADRQRSTTSSRVLVTDGRERDQRREHECDPHSASGHLGAVAPGWSRSNAAAHCS
jgi:nitroimidazol reductase NimA-like FMN-containing flavoprotein (pyridoxamine 5'-phosphate oxidase superfamily)